MLMGPLDRNKPVFPAPKDSARDEVPSGKSVGEAASGVNVEIPPELMGRMSLSLSTPNNFIFVRNAVNKFNQGAGTAIDPIDIANALTQKGYNIVAIPERKVDITPTPEGLILDKKQVLQILTENRLAEFPLLQVAIGQVRYLSAGAGDSLEGATERIGKILMGDRRERLEDSELRGVVAKYLLDSILLDFRYGHSGALAAHNDAPREEQEKLAQLVLQQATFLFDNMDNRGQLLTKDERIRHERRHEIAKEEDRQARESRREELFASREAAERWLFGVARGEFRDAGEDITNAAQKLAQSRRAQELIAHHGIDLFQYVDKQLKSAQERDYGRRRDRGYEQLPVAVLLGAFAKSRTIEDSPNSIREKPADHLYGVINLWLNARFTAELPGGVYDEVIAGEEAYRQERRGVSREQDFFLEQAFGKFGKDVQHREKESSLRRDSSVAVLWWTIPLWKQWKFLRPHIREEMGKTQGQSRGFTPRKFLEHIGGLINEESRNIKLQNALLASLDKGDKKAALEGYWKEIMEVGKPSDEKRAAMGKYQAEAEQDFPTEERAQEIISSSQERIRRLEEIKDLFNVDFVMSKPERDAEIEKRQKERASRQLPRFRW